MTETTWSSLAGREIRCPSCDSTFLRPDKETSLWSHFKARSAAIPWKAIGEGIAAVIDGLATVLFGLFIVCVSVIALVLVISGADHFPKAAIGVLIVIGCVGCWLLNEIRHHLRKLAEKQPVSVEKLFL